MCLLIFEFPVQVDGLSQHFEIEKIARISMLPETVIAAEFPVRPLAKAPAAAREVNKEMAASS